jgi:hypothetical protein
MDKPVNKPARHSASANPERRDTPFTEADYSLQTLLGGMSVEKFLAEHWHKKPLLVRQALPNFGDWLDRDSLSELACQDNSEGRLVQFKRGRCELQYGPFEMEELAACRNATGACWFPASTICCPKATGCCTASTSSRLPAWTT